MEWQVRQRRSCFIEGLDENVLRLGPIRIAGNANLALDRNSRTSVPMVASYAQPLTSLVKVTSYCPESAVCSTGATATTPLERSTVPSALTTAQLFWPCRVATVRIHFPPPPSPISEFVCSTRRNSPDYGSEGRGFKSLTARHFFLLGQLLGSGSVTTDDFASVRWRIRDTRSIAPGAWRATLRDRGRLRREAKSARRAPLPPKSDRRFAPGSRPIGNAFSF